MVAKMPKSPGQTILILGPTGNTGRHALRHALDAGDDVHVFVRNPSKLEPAVKARVHVIVGDLTNPTSVADAVRSVSPSAIIICSGHPPKDRIAPLNVIAVAAITNALTETQRLEECFVVYLSGLLSDPAYDPLPWYIKLLRPVIVSLSGYQASLRDNLDVTRYLTADEGSESGLQFTIVRMGYPIEAPSKGAIVPIDFNPTGAVTFNDIGLFLVKLAHGDYRSEVLGKAIKVFYGRR